MTCADCGIEGQHRRGGGYCLERQLAAARAEAEHYLSAHEACVADLARAGAVADELRLGLAHTEALLEDARRDWEARLHRALGLTRLDIAKAAQAETETVRAHLTAALAAEGKDPKEGSNG